VKSNTFKAALRGHSAMIAAGALAASLTTTAAWAQDAPPPQPDEATVASTIAGADTAEGAIIVTGTRISRPDLKSTVPISIVTGDSFIRQGNSNVGDALNDFPQLRATRGQQNSNLGVGISGLNLLDLRGLGTQRTLVLVDGRRHVAADVLSNGVSVDINTIPANLIERVDIVTGSNSAVYGSDAIAGVANFIPKGWKSAPRPLFPPRAVTASTGAQMRSTARTSPTVAATLPSRPNTATRTASMLRTCRGHVARTAS
jgi:outer membrane receptor protein involved in Fe transport